jgi:hypothetical protein
MISAPNNVHRIVDLAVTHPSPTDARLDSDAHWSLDIQDLAKMEVEVPQRHDRIPTPRTDEPPPLYSTTSATTFDASDLPAYHDIEPGPPQLFPRRRRSRAIHNPRNATLDSQFPPTRLCQRATAEHNEYPFSPQPTRNRRPSQIDTSDPYFCLPQDGDDAHTALLREFARSKLYVNDSWVAQKEARVDEVDESSKLFGWMRRKLSSSRKAEAVLAEAEQNSENRKY